MGEVFGGGGVAMGGLVSARRGREVLSWRVEGWGSRVGGFWSRMEWRHRRQIDERRGMRNSIVLVSAGGVVVCEGVENNVRTAIEVREEVAARNNFSRHGLLILLSTNEDILHLAQQTNSPYIAPLEQ